jgi:hypothetical protein
MKKMFTFLVATGLVSAAMAQDYHGNYGRPDNRYPNQVVVVDHRFDNRPAFNFHERDEQVARINHEFDFKISSVAHRWFMSRQRKDYEIACLQNEREQRIREVFARFGGRDDFYHNGFARNGRY